MMFPAEKSQICPSRPTLSPSLSTWPAQANNNSSDQKNREEEKDEMKKIEELAAQIGKQVGSDQLSWTQRLLEEGEVRELSAVEENTEVREFSPRNEMNWYGTTSFGNSRRYELSVILLFSSGNDC